MLESGCGHDRCQQRAIDVPVARHQRGLPGGQSTRRRHQSEGRRAEPVRAEVHDHCGEIRHGEPSMSIGVEDSHCAVGRDKDVGQREVAVRGRHRHRPTGERAERGADPDCGFSEIPTRRLQRGEGGVDVGEDGLGVQRLGRDTGDVVVIPAEPAAHPSEYGRHTVPFPRISHERLQRLPLEPLHDDGVDLGEVAPHPDRGEALADDRGRDALEHVRLFPCVLLRSGGESLRQRWRLVPQRHLHNEPRQVAIRGHDLGVELVRPGMAIRPTWPGRHGSLAEPARHGGLDGTADSSGTHSCAPMKTIRRALDIQKRKASSTEAVFLTAKPQAAHRETRLTAGRI